MPERNTKPTVDLINFTGLATKLNPDLLEQNQLVIAENCDFYKEFGSLRKARGTSRVLDAIYTESGVAMPASWLGFYKSQDFSGQLIRSTIAQLGTTIRKINTDGTTTNFPVGATTADPTLGVAQPNKLYRSRDMFDRLMLVTGQDPFKGGRRGTFFKYDGFRTSNWGVIAPGRQETIAVAFDSSGSFSPSGCTLATEDTIAYYNNSVKMIKNAAASSCSFDLLNTTPTSFVSTIEDRGEIRLYIPQDEFRNLALSGRAISVYFGSDATFANNFYRFDFRIGELVPGWNTLVFDFSTVPTGNAGSSTGSLVSTAVISYRFEALFSNSVPVVNLYWDHLVSLDAGTASPALGSIGNIFNASSEAIWQYKFTFVNEYGTESNAGPASVEIDLTGVDGFNDVVEVNFDSASGWTTNSTNSLSADVSVKTQGTASLKLNKSATASGITTGTMVKSGLALDLTDAFGEEAFIDLFIPIGCRTKLASTGVTVELGDDSLFSNKILYNIDKNDLEEGDWETFTLDLANPDNTVGVLDLAAVDSIRITFIFTSNTQTSDNLRADNFAILTTNNYDNIALTSLPISVDPGVVARKIYRTVAGGTDFLFVTTINDNVTTTYDDLISDGSLGVTTPPEAGQFNDNGPPPFAAFMKVWKRTVFMAGDPLNPNVLYFGRDDEPESFPIINGFELDTPITGMYETSLGLIVTTETDFWRVVGDNPDYFLDKVRKGMGNTGFRACGETRMFGWCTDRDGVRLFDLRDTNKISDIISDQFDDLDRVNLEHIWSIHSRAHYLMIFAFPDNDNVYNKFLIYQYGGNDDVRQGWWWTLSLAAGLEFLCAEEIEDANGDFHLYVGGNDGMIYDLFNPTADNWVNASGAATAVRLRIRTPWVRAGSLGAEFEGVTGRVLPTFIELRAREEDAEAHTWTMLVETADGSATDGTVRDSQTLSYVFPAGQCIQRYRTQNLTAGEYFRLTVTHEQLDKHVIFQGIRVYLDVKPSQYVVVGDAPGGQG